MQRSPGALEEYYSAAFYSPVARPLTTSSHPQGRITYKLRWKLKLLTDCGVATDTRV